MSKIDTASETAFVWVRSSKRQVLTLLLLLIAILSVRILTLQFMRSHLNDPAWFQIGSYAKFDRQARDILAGKQNLFSINDPTRTDLAQYPPAFPWLVVVIYKVTGSHSPYTVQLVLWSIDIVISLVLITGIAVTAFGWRAGIVSGFLAGSSPLLAMYGAWPSTDPPTTWLVLAANWSLLIACKRSNSWFAVLAGVVLGAACWFRVNPLYLGPVWAFGLLLVKIGWRKRVIMSTAVLVGSSLIIAPIVIRNYISFPDFTPTGGTIGTNLWEGLGETELGRNNGFLFGDDKMIERERVKLGLPADFPIEAQWPDGIRRDQERVRESLAFIKQHPMWYAGVMLKRMWGMLKVAGEPTPFYGSSGINVTSQKCLPPEWQGGALAAGVNLLGMAQSVTRHLFLPFTILGIVLATRRNRMATAVLGATILYYLIPGTAAHTEIRYVLPMHALLTIFAGLSVVWLTDRLRRNKSVAVMAVSEHQ